MSSDPAFEEAAVKRLAAAAGNDEVLSNPFLQSSGGHDDLENRTRRKLCLDRFVEQRLAGIGDQLVPLITRYAHREFIGIERGMADHRQNFAIARIHGDDGAGSAIQRLLGRYLHIEIDGELELL